MSKRKNMLLSMAPLLVFLFAAALPSGAEAQTIGSVADGAATSSFDPLLNLFSGLCYIIGAIFGVKAAGQLIEHTNNSQQVKLSKPVVSLAVAAMLLSIPSFLGMLVDTFGFLTSVGGSPFSGLAGGTPTAAADLGGMFKAFATSIPSLMKLISLGAVCAGAFLILKAVLLLPQVEQGRVESGKVIWLLISGVGLWALLPFISMAMGTMTMAAPTSADFLMAKYTLSQGSDFNAVIASVLTFVQLLGLIAFVRGVLILKALGENKDGAMGRALTHIFGGAAAMNIGWTVGMIATSIGANATICGISTALC